VSHLGDSGGLIATTLAREIDAMDEFTLISRGDKLPVFAFTTADRVTGWDVFAVSRGRCRPGRRRRQGGRVRAVRLPSLKWRAPGRSSTNIDECDMTT